MENSNNKEINELLPSGKRNLNDEFSIDFGAMIEELSNNVLIYSFGKVFNDKKQENKEVEFLNSLLFKLRLSKITKTFSDNHLTDGMNIKVNESVLRLEQFINEFIIPQYGGNDDLPNEPIPEYEYKTIAQKIAWLHELGIIQTILNKCEQGNGYNWSRAANIIHTFTDINLSTLKNTLMAIYNPDKKNMKNNPLNNPDNILFLTIMKEKFKLNK